MALMFVRTSTPTEADDDRVFDGLDRSHIILPIRERYGVGILSQQ